MENNSPVELILGPMIGGLSSRSAKIWGRGSHPADMYVWVGDRPVIKDAKPAGSCQLTAGNGFAGFLQVDDLQPDTKYYYAVSLQNRSPGQAAGSFRTLPGNGYNGDISFAFGSCNLPGSAEADIFKHIGDKAKEKNIRFALLIGDQVYADYNKKNGIGKIAESLEDYRRLYTFSWGRKHFRDTFKSLPVFMTPDDHEVDDDWRWRDPGRQKPGYLMINTFRRILSRRRPINITRERVANALQAFWEHQVIHSPRSVDLGIPFEYLRDTPNYYSFEIGKAAFFVMDTRSHRVRSFLDFKNRTMLGPEQWQEFESWLLQVKDSHPVKFVVTSSGFLMRHWIDVFNDRWKGFGKERKRLINFAADNKIKGVHLLSGDLHASGIVTAVLDGKIPFTELGSSPFEQKPARFLKYTFFGLPFSRVSKIKRHVFIGEQNFAVVTAKFDEEEFSGVTVEYFGADGSSLAEHQVNADPL